MMKKENDENKDVFGKTSEKIRKKSQKLTEKRLAFFVVCW